MGKERYEPFQEALYTATEKLDEYYTKTAASDAHIIAMGTFHPFSLFYASHLNLWPYSATPRKEDVAFQEVLEQSPSGQCT